MDSNDKERTQQRYRRQLRHFESYDEQKQRKARRHQRGRWRDDDDGFDGADDDGGAADFQKMHRRPPGGASAHRDRSSAEFCPNTAELEATVIWLGQGRARILTDGPTGEERPALLHHDLAQEQRSAIAVGDRVTVHERTAADPLVVAVAPRRSELARPDGGEDSERRHVLAANVDDVVLVLTAERLRPGLVDRLRAATADSGAALMICINKCDLPHDRAALDRTLAPFVESGPTVLFTSAQRGDGIDELQSRLGGRTAAFVGHSGVGKSTLLNRLDPESDRRTGDVRSSDGRGRHTTTASQLRRLADGTQLIDTPGVRMFGLVAAADGIAAAFPEIVALGANCRFRDCRHGHEPGCAVRAAVEAEELDAARYAAYCKLVAEDRAQ